MPAFFSVYSAVTADPLHQIEQGIFGKHIWPNLRDGFSKKQATVLDTRLVYPILAYSILYLRTMIRFKNLPRYPDLKHFPNGVTTLKNVTGMEHGVILHVCEYIPVHVSVLNLVLAYLQLLAPLIEDLLPKASRKITLKVLRSLSKIHMLSKFTTHTEATLEDLEQEIEIFGDSYSVRVLFSESTPLIITV
jgi:hypothetical protein